MVWKVQYIVDCSGKVLESFVDGRNWRVRVKRGKVDGKNVEEN